MTRKSIIKILLLSILFILIIFSSILIFRKNPPMQSTTSTPRQFTSNVNELAPISNQPTSNPSPFVPNLNQFTSSFNDIINAYHLPSMIGIQIQSMTTGKILYHRDSDHLFVPASDLKLFTAAAALLYLKPDYKIQTTLMTNTSTISQGVLFGHVYLKFNGDPVLTTQNLNELIESLKQKGVKTITGNFYIDERDIDDKRYGPGWMWDDLNSCFAAPTKAIIINQNCFNSVLIPAKQPNNHAQLKIPENNGLTSIDNQVMTVTHADTSHCPLELKSDEQNHYVLTGCVFAGRRPIGLQIAVKNPMQYAKKLMAVLLKSNHIQLKGKILSATVPKNLKPLSTHQSPQLYELVKTMLKHSNDQIADALMMQLAKNYYHQPATWRLGVKAMQAILSEQAHIDLSTANMVDGSGISTYNLVTPQQISQLLYFAYHDSNIKSYFLEALPIAGVDGTLRNRMKKNHVRKHLRAKTGTLAGVSSLSGYVKTIHGQIFSFVILVNNFLEKNTRQTKSMEDAIGKFLFFQKN